MTAFTRRALFRAVALTATGLVTVASHRPKPAPTSGFGVAPFGTGPFGN